MWLAKGDDPRLCKYIITYHRLQCATHLLLVEDISYIIPTLCYFLIYIFFRNQNPVTWGPLVCYSTTFRSRKEGKWFLYFFAQIFHIPFNHLILKWKSWECYFLFPLFSIKIHFHFYGLSTLQHLLQIRW